MSRTALTVAVVPAFGAGLADSGLAAVDQGNGNSIPNNDGKIVLLVTRTGGALNTTVSGPATNRTAGKTISQVTTTADGKTSVIGPFDPNIFNQSDGSVNVDYDTGTNAKVAAVRLTPTPAA